MHTHFLGQRLKTLRNFFSRGEADEIPGYFFRCIKSWWGIMLKCSINYILKKFGVIFVNFISFRIMRFKKKTSVNWHPTFFCPPCSRLIQSKAWACVGFDNLGRQFTDLPPFLQRCLCEAFWLQEVGIMQINPPAFPANIPFFLLLSSLGCAPRGELLILPFYS